MPESARILLCGLDEVLLATRRWILEGAGFRVCIATTPDEFGRFVLNQDLQLVLICYTMSKEACEAALATTHTLRPDVMTVVLTENLPGYSMDMRGEITSTLEGPKALIATAKRYLSQRTLQSRSIAENEGKRPLL